MKVIDNKGFTLIEAVIALGVLSIGIIAMFSMQTMGIKGNTSANRVTETSTWAADKTEEIVSLRYDKLIDRNKNGTNHDANKNGVDDSAGGNFGLNDTATGVTVNADGCGSIPKKNPEDCIPDLNSKYIVYWNVAVDHPIRGVKTLQINVLNIATNKIGSIQYKKFDKI